MKEFSEEERERIRQGLIENGKELFGRYGLKKTTISDLTDSVGIANSTFYQFFDSKESLYISVIRDEAENVMDGILEESVEKEDDTKKEIEELLRMIFEAMEQSPLIQTLIAEGEIDDLTHRLSDEEHRELRNIMVKHITPYVEEWMEKGEIKGEDPEVVAGTIQATTLLTLHREKLNELYPEVRNLMIESVSSGIVIDSDSEKPDTDSEKSD